MKGDNDFWDLNTKKNENDNYSLFTAYPPPNKRVVLLEIMNFKKSEEVKNKYLVEEFKRIFNNVSKKYIPKKFLI